MSVRIFRPRLYSYMPCLVVTSILSLIVLNALNTHTSPLYCGDSSDCNFGFNRMTRPVLILKEDNPLRSQITKNEVSVSGSRLKTRLLGIVDSSFESIW